MAFQHTSKTKLLAEIYHIHMPVQYRVCSLQDPHKINIMIDKRNGIQICKKCKRKILQNEETHFHYHIQLDCKILSAGEASNPKRLGSNPNPNPNHTPDPYSIQLDLERFPNQEASLKDLNLNPSSKSSMIANQAFHSNKIISFLCFNQSYFYSTQDKNEILNEIWRGELFWIWMKQKDINSLNRNMILYPHTKMPSFIVSKLVPAFDDVQNLLLNRTFTSNLNQFIQENVELDIFISQDSQLNETLMFESTEDFDETDDNEREITERMNTLQFQSQSQSQNFETESSKFNNLKEEWYLNWESFKNNTFSNEIPSTPEQLFHKFASESIHNDLFIPPSDDEEQEDAVDFPNEELPSTQQLCNILAEMING